MLTKQGIFVSLRLVITRGQKLLLQFQRGEGRDGIKKFRINVSGEMILELYKNY